MKKIAIPSLLVITLLLAAGCKPTEKNYKAAYDVALGKRKAVEAEMAEAAGGHEVISLDGPRRITAGGVEMNMVSEFLRMADKDEPLPSPALRYRVAAGRYRMPTNARAQMQTRVATMPWPDVSPRPARQPPAWPVCASSSRPRRSSVLMATRS